jgi:Flp pilus assembly protein TadG
VKAILPLTDRFWRRLSALRRDSRGVAAIEFALIASTLSIGVLNVVDIGVFAYKRMEVENAGQAGAQAAWAACPQDQLPATTNCSALTTAVTTAIQSTSLGTHVTAATPTEGYYCVSSAGVLTYVSAVSTKPADCSSVGGTASPADYVTISVSYTYAPIFPGITVASAFPTDLSKTTYMRMQ